MRICRISASTAPVSKLIKQVQVQKNKIDDGSQNLQNPDENREKYEQNQCIGITRGGRNTKIHAVVDGIGYPIHIQLSSGNISDVSIAQEVLSHVNLDGTIVMGDKAYGAKELRDYITDHNADYCIPPKSNTVAPWYCDWHQYKERHLVECFFNRLKENHRIATRFDKLASRFLAFVYLGSIRIMLA